MCGILGVIGPRSFDREGFGRPLDAIKNRWPDDRGVYEELERPLGHRVQAINPSDEALLSLYAARGIVVFVYQYEGFGLSISEA